jgi:hypothetical protein
MSRLCISGNFHATRGGLLKSKSDALHFINSHNLLRDYSELMTLRLNQPIYRFPIYFGLNFAIDFDRKKWDKRTQSVENIMNVKILPPVLLVVLAFTLQTSHASSLIYGATVNPAPLGIDSSSTFTITDSGSLVAANSFGNVNPNDGFTVPVPIQNTVVPEPSVTMLGAMGLLGLLIFQRCKKGQRQIVALIRK